MMSSYEKSYLLLTEALRVVADKVEKCTDPMEAWDTLSSIELTVEKALQEVHELEAEQSGEESQV